MELSEDNLSKQSSLSTVGNKLSQKALPLIIEEKAPNYGGFLAPQGRDTRRKSIAARKPSHNTSVINTEELRDSVTRLAPPHVNEERSSASSQSLSRLQAKVSSFNAFAGVQKSNRAEKRREVCNKHERVECFIRFPNTEKRVENTTRSGVFLKNYGVFGNLRNLLNRNCNYEKNRDINLKILC